jgi:predicted GNAT family acetyltransferase
MSAAHPLDNPIWSALNTEQGHFSIGNSLAGRFLPEIGPLSATCDQTTASYDALRRLVEPREMVVVFLESPIELPAGWSCPRYGQIDQMILLSSKVSEPDALPTGATLRRLTTADIPAMLELTALTEPGPFRQRTMELGAFWGIFHGDRLVSMAGQRLHLPQFIEISAVCTHPDARGRGYANQLLATVRNAILRRCKTPFLHVLSENHSAIRVYNAMGFALRRSLHFAVLLREA